MSNKNKSKLITPPDINQGFMLPDGEVLNLPKSPKIVGVKPAGCQVYIEFLTAQELANTNITITEKTDIKNYPMQGYIIDVGPTFRKEDWGYGIGDRVMISGSVTIAPKIGDNHRDRFIMEPAYVKCVLLEEK